MYIKGDNDQYCEDIQGWNPVQLSWIQGLSEEYYKVHFTVLFQQFLIPSILPSEREKLATSIVDFSQAQQNGFLAAYCKVLGIAAEMRPSRS
ncbi:hypothetical protein MJO28_002901 [Puccinia striiformis f. sp. tritici]|uniref:Uncharacterized protein n=1 Tax=Puccinia striiformis f. sp. tritici TaxID=168172 RepID=A0ACC0ER79_9BASI|nr:hypothetical protein MJO28_002901 [Puccinia striiformis f. sp. tritici]